MNKDYWKFGRMGHFVTVCKQVNKLRVATVDEDSKKAEQQGEILCIGDVDIKHRRSSRPETEFVVNGSMVELIIDSGSMHTIVRKAMFLEHWKSVIWLPKDFNPVGYQGAKMYIVGYMETTVEFGSTVIKVKVYVAEDGTPILGWMQHYDLNIVVNPRAANQVMAVIDISLSNIPEKARDVFKEKCSYLKGYVHNIVLKPDAVPVQHKLRRIPLVARAPVKEMLEEIIALG
ncbi:hypothetical protein NDU88_005444 [Pleurodeles waltl]|uniref:Uncharacterized protein n=1 Tax=Pleurodeles waltl TaxID=8319 RepID=A0AAV7PKD9_PLEWA|nr:hypothetical protein NDU88_005444 [Pleurodeles waltl]